MRYQINSTGNIILADAEFVESNHSGDYTLLPDLPKPANPPILSAYRFKRRFTQSERVAIRKAAATSPAIYDYMDMLDTAPSVNLTDTLTQDGIKSMAMMGLLTAGRAAEILDTPVSDEEMG